MKATLGRNFLKHYYLAINDGQTESLYWGSGNLEDAIISIPALLEEHPDLENADDFQKFYNDHQCDSPDELDELENVLINESIFVD